jgi:hypothetical protein
MDITCMIIYTAETDYSISALVYTLQIRTLLSMFRIHSARNDTRVLAFQEVIQCSVPRLNENFLPKLSLKQT